MENPAPAPDPGSPCTGLCRIGQATGWCLGCKRTLDEIAAWPGLTPEDRRTVLASLVHRKPSETGR